VAAVCCKLLPHKLQAARAAELLPCLTQLILTWRKKPQQKALTNTAA